MHPQSSEDRQEKKRTQHRLVLIEKGVMLLLAALFLMMYWQVNWSGNRSSSKRCFTGMIQSLYPKTAADAQGNLTYDLRSATEETRGAARIQYYACIALSGIDVRSMPSFDDITYRGTQPTPDYSPELIPLETGVEQL